MKTSIDRRRDLPRIERGVGGEVLIGRRTHACVVENTSPGGAGLRLAPGLLLPDAFQLALDRQVVTVSVAWRREERVGVFFTSPWRRRR